MSFSFVAQAGGTVGAVPLRNAVTFRATGTDSVLDLRNLETVTGGQQVIQIERGIVTRRRKSDSLCGQIELTWYIKWGRRIDFQSVRATNIR